jgi:DNA-binding beta-propeller fold protein YncE
LLQDKNRRNPKLPQFLMDKIMHTNKTVTQIVLAVCLWTSHLAHSAQAPESIQFTITNRYSVGGEGGWDLLSFDAKHHRLFVSRSSHVQVIDTDSGKVAGEIPNTDGVHGIALAEDLGVGFTSNGKSNSVTAFDLDTLKVIETIKISGVNPDVILYESQSKHIFSFNGRSANATVIDAVSRKEIASISLPGKPELAISDDAGNIFVNIEDKNEIVVMDGESGKVLKHFPLGTGEDPTGLAIDRKHNRLFSVCANNKMVILDSGTGKVVAEVTIGSSPDSAGFDPELGIAFSSNGDGTLTLVKEEDPDHFSVLQNVPTKKGARTMAYDSDKHRAYLVTASFGETPPATKEQPKPRPPIIKDSFEVLVVSLKH